MSDNNSQQRYGRWYANKGGDRNERRREVYARDEERRTSNQARSRAWRQERQQGVAVSREVYRFVNGKRVRVWSLGQIADQTGYAANTLRWLVVNGELPEPTVPGVHRYYTGVEVKAIKALLKKRR